MADFIARAFQAIVFGLLGYSFPRLLVAAGVPIDRWINNMGATVGQIAWLNYESVTWAFVIIFTIAMLLIERRFNVIENMFYKARPSKLKREAITQATDLIAEAQTLLSTQPKHDAHAWGAGVIHWNQRVEELLKKEFPQRELFGFQSAAPAPRTEQTVGAAMQSLNGRFQKFRLIVLRHLPPSWS